MRFTPAESSGNSRGGRLLHELQEAGLQERPGDRDDAYAATAFHALSAAPLLLRVGSQVLVQRFLEGHAPDVAFLDDVGQLQLTDFIDPGTGIQAKGVGCIVANSNLRIWGALVVALRECSHRWRAAHEIWLDKNVNKLTDGFEKVRITQCRLTREFVVKGLGFPTQDCFGYLQ